MFKSKLFATLKRACLNLFKIFLLFIDFVETIDFRDRFILLFFFNLIDFNNINLFRDSLDQLISNYCLFKIF